MCASVTRCLGLFQGALGLCALAARASPGLTGVAFLCSVALGITWVSCSDVNRCNDPFFTFDPLVSSLESCVGCSLKPWWALCRHVSCKQAYAYRHTITTGLAKPTPLQIRGLAAAAQTCRLAECVFLLFQNSSGVQVTICIFHTRQGQEIKFC